MKTDPPKDQPFLAFGIVKRAVDNVWPNMGSSDDAKEALNENNPQWAVVKLAYDGNYYTRPHGYYEMWMDKPIKWSELPD